MIASPLRGLRTAWMLLTRIPWPSRHSSSASDGIDRAAEGPAPEVRAAPAWFPLVGAVVGALIAAVYVTLFDLVGAFTAAAIALSVGALLTGALHQDGLADVADAFGGGWTVERRLEILHDSRIGAYGALTLVGAFVVQTSALAQHDRAQGAAVLVAAHSLSRGGVVVLMRLAPGASRISTGVGATFTRGLGNAATTGAALSALVLGTVALGRLVPLAVSVVVAAVGLMGALAWRKIGGVTGDVLGAAEQLAETAVLVTGAALVRHVDTWPWWR